ncbi:MAG: hypothetical protein ACLSTO_01915 [Bilophila wadsworthia]
MLLRLSRRKLRARAACPPQIGPQFKDGDVPALEREYSAVRCHHAPPTTTTLSSLGLAGEDVFGGNG